MINTILISIGCIVALPLIIGIFMKKTHYVKREIVIDAPSQKAFDFLRFLKNQDKFNQSAAADPNRKIEYKGTDGTIGFKILWIGNKEAGCGEKEIMNIIEGKRIVTQIRFVKPMKTSADIIIETESLSNNKTRVSMSNAGKLFYPLNIMIPMFEKMFGKDIDNSLNNLKNLLEK